MDGASALIDTRVRVKDGQQTRDVSVQQGEHSSPGTLVMQFDAGTVFEMCSPLDTKCSIGLFLPPDQGIEDVFDDLASKVKAANLIVSSDSSRGTFCMCI